MNKKYQQCAIAIKTIVEENYNGESLSKDLAEKIVVEFGFETTKKVVVVSILQTSWDSRISEDNKNWGISNRLEKPHFTDKERFKIRVYCNPLLLNIFTDQLRILESEIEK